MLKRYPLLILALFWLLGMYLGSMISFEKPLLVVFILLGISLLLLSFMLYHIKGYIWLGLLILFTLMLSVARANWYQLDYKMNISEEMVAKQANQTVGIRGYIASKPLIDGNQVKFNLKPIAIYQNGEEYLIATKEQLLIYLYLDQEEQLAEVNSWYATQGIRLFGQFEKINSATNPGQFDYQVYLQQRGVYWKVVVDDLSKITISEGNSLFASAYKIKNQLLANVDRLFAEPQAGFVKSIVLGYRNDLAEDIRDDFAILGLSHLLAISGLHLSILTMMLYGLLLNFGLTKQRAIYIVSAILLGYLLLTGISASAVRATIMTLLMFYGLIFNSRFTALQSLGLAVILMTLIKPMWIYDIGFQLSITITFFIVAFLPLISQRLPIANNYLKNALALIIISQLAAFPLVFYYFHQYSLLGWLLNLIIVPIFSLVILPLGVITLFLASFKLYIANYLALILSGLLDMLFTTLPWFAKLSVLHFYGHFSSFIIVILLYIGLSWLLIRYNVRKAFISYKLKRFIFKLEKLLLIVMLGFFSWQYLKVAEGLITFIDVGQGDSILIETPTNKQLLIDSGGSYQYIYDGWQQRKHIFDVGGDVVLPYLHYQGIRTLDVAILTHEDLDHIGGYLSLVDNVKIKYFVVNSQFPITELGKELYQKLKENQVEIIQVAGMKELKIDKFTKLSFVPINITDSTKTNDHTMGIYLSMYDTDIFFAADIEAKGEKLILAANNVKPVEILKVGHHGSKTSTTQELLAALKPKLAVISVGRKNIYRHPANEVVESLANNGIRIYRTDNDGALLLHIVREGFYIEKTLR